MSDLLACLLFLMALGLLYVCWTLAIRYLHGRTRRCPNHGHEADQRAAIAQTALTMRMLGLAVTGSASMLAAPRAVTQGWPGLVLGVALGGTAVLLSARWRRRREKQLGFDQVRCGL